MLYNYREIIVGMLLLPVVLNIVLPLAISGVWLVRQLFMGTIWRVKRREGMRPDAAQNEAPLAV